MKPKPEFCLVNNNRVRYYEIGKGNDLLFLHGGGLKAESYKENLAFLGSMFHVIAPDIPCYGGSFFPQAVWDFSDYAGFFLEFTKTLKLKNYFLVGYSFGGGIALHLATLDKNISGIVLCNCAGSPKKYNFSKFSMLILREAFTAFSAIRTPEQFRIFIRIVFDFVLSMSGRAFKMKKLTSIVFSSLKTGLPDLSMIKNRVFLVWSDNDTFFNLNDARSLTGKIKKSKLEIILGSHLWILLKHKTFADLFEKEFGSA